MAPQKEGLYLKRVRASKLSGGTSSDTIHATVERVIASQNLGGRVLDYGAGTGSLTRRLLALRRFDTVAAADIMPAPEDMPGEIEWIEQDLNLPLTRHENAFDVVVAAEVIEHLENPRFMVRELYSILRPGGIIILTTPNNESWRSLVALVIRGHYALFGDLNYPAHITPILRKDFIRIFTEAGFTTPSFHFTNEGGVPGKPVVTWQQISFGLLNGLRFSDNFLAIATKPLGVLTRVDHSAIAPYANSNAP
jgi:2-polyprenyl-3-methyl-5-hydroxy-6-metoxy-1,4-benzoquinol methylase